MAERKVRRQGVLKDLGPDVQASFQKVICVGEEGPLLRTPGESQVGLCARMRMCVAE